MAEEEVLLDEDNTEQASAFHSPPLFGRTEILTAVDEITESNILDVLHKALGVHSTNATQIDYLYGSNNYKESALRQHLISSAAAGSVWTPQTKYDRPPAWASTLAGFAGGLPEDFLAIVGEVNLPCVTNTVFESPDSSTVINSAYTLHDKFYLLSRCEVFGTTETAADTSTLLAYFDGATNADRIGYLTTGAAASQWLRTCNLSTADVERVVLSDGSLLNGYAYISYAYAPAFTIV